MTMEGSLKFESLHDLPFPPETVWPGINNTDWVNRSLGLPPVSYEFTAKPEGGSSVRARARIAGLETVWQEFPFEWLEPEFYRVRRVFENGPLREATLGLELLRQARAVEPRNPEWTTWLASVYGRAVRDVFFAQDPGSGRRSFTSTGAQRTISRSPFSTPSSR